MNLIVQSVKFQNVFLSTYSYNRNKPPVGIDLSISADAVDVRNDLQKSLHPQAVVDKKKEHVL